MNSGEGGGGLGGPTEPEGDKERERMNSGGGSAGAPTTEPGPEEEDEELRQYPPLSEAEIEYFAARMNLLPETLRHIVAPMDGVAGIDLRTDLEDWAAENAEEEARCAGMSLAQLIADSKNSTFMTEVTAALHRAHELLASSWIASQRGKYIPELRKE